LATVETVDMNCASYFGAARRKAEFGGRRHMEQWSRDRSQCAFHVAAEARSAEQLRGNAEYL
jgi:hypothetical protein